MDSPAIISQAEALLCASLRPEIHLYKVNHHGVEGWTYAPAGRPVLAVRAMYSAEQLAPLLNSLLSWKAAVEDELVCCGILNTSHNDPRKALQDAITWNTNVALDPLVSSDAQELQQAAKLAVVESVAKTIYEQWSYHPNYRPWMEGGNSINQDKARQLARKALGV